MWFKIFLASAGLLCLLAVLFDWAWFFNNWRARPIVEALGKEVAQLFYALLGACFLFAAYYLEPESTAQGSARTSSRTAPASPQSPTPDPATARPPQLAPYP
ncbi:MAG: hypothetical protein KA795_06940 [Burkholderiaceae bacterium]|nr:hypothetical protein [Burkholderiaceae bacterium]